MESYWFAYVTIFLVGLVQVPLAVDLLRFVFPKWKLARLASRSIHFILFSIVGTIFCIGLGYHLFVYLPLLAGEKPLRSLKGLVHIVFALWVWINVVGNYYYSVFLHPGVDRDYKPPSSSHKSKSNAPKLCFMSEDGVITEVNEEESSVQHQNGTTSVKTFYCAASLIGTGGSPGPRNGVEWKPNRTHYCKICESAVPYLDHHCPFTGNCAGLRNYANFFLGLLYGTLGLLYAVLITLPYFFECNFKNILWYFRLVSSRERQPVCDDLGPHTHIFLPVFAGLCLAGNMFLLQVFFLAADLSTYNIISNRSKFPMLRFMVQRIKARKYREKNSRWNVLFRNQKKTLWSILVPTNSTQLC
jgi:hypothetical protein